MYISPILLVVKVEQVHALHLQRVAIPTTVMAQRSMAWASSWQVLQPSSLFSELFDRSWWIVNSQSGIKTLHALLFLSVYSRFQSVYFCFSYSNIRLFFFPFFPNKTAIYLQKKHSSSYFLDSYGSYTKSHNVRRQTLSSTVLSLPRYLAKEICLWKFVTSFFSLFVSLSEDKTKHVS